MFRINRAGIAMSERNGLPVKKEGTTCCELQDLAYSQSSISGNPALHQEDRPTRQRLSGATNRFDRSLSQINVEKGSPKINQLIFGRNPIWGTKTEKL